MYKLFYTSIKPNLSHYSMQKSILQTQTTFDASSLKIGVVMASFNSDITESMLSNMLYNCPTYNIDKNNVTICRVPGAVEIPLVLSTMAKKFDCLVALGCIIRGDTPHFDYVCKYVTEGILRVSLDNHIPIGYGILTLENHEQSATRIISGFGSLEAALQSHRQISQLLGN